MYDLASQLVMKWARQGPETPIEVTKDFTRLTLDTIGTSHSLFKAVDMR